MLNPFPEFLTFAMLAPFMLRLAVSAVLFVRAKDMLKANPHTLSKIIAYAEILCGVLLLIGLFTQIVSMVLVVMFVLSFSQKTPMETPVTRAEKLNALLIVAISLSLILTSGGAFALDLPL